MGKIIAKIFYPSHSDLLETSFSKSIERNEKRFLVEVHEFRVTAVLESETKSVRFVRNHNTDKNYF